jgi:hypothetical protein
MNALHANKLRADKLRTDKLSVNASHLSIAKEISLRQYTCHRLREAVLVD